MKIAVIGAGIAGLSAAWLLEHHSARRHTVTLFESADYLGGHTNSIDVTIDGLKHRVDTGFLVYNDWTYPNLIGLFDTLGVLTAKSDMSFSVKVSDGQDKNESELEWSGSNLATVFAQPRNVLRPAFWSMLRDLLRFNRQTTWLVENGLELKGTVGEFLQKYRYGNAFRDWYLKPMAACIWSTPTHKIDAFPLLTFLTFCHNHGLLSVSHRPQWRTVVNGAKSYVEKMAAALSDARIHAHVTRIRRRTDGVDVVTKNKTESFDRVILACHSNQALAVLEDANEAERNILSAIPYQANRAVLHTDTRLLPQRQRAWAAWNYLSSSSGDTVSLTYLINKLQPLPFTTPVMVTMNPPLEPLAEKIIAEFQYEHPLYLPASVEAQRELKKIQGQRHTHFAGAWTRYGFHEDGLLSGMAVAEALGAVVPWQTT